MRMAREVYIPFLACLLVFSGRYLTMAPGSVLSVQLLGRGWWEGLERQAKTLGGEPLTFCETRREGFRTVPQERQAGGV